jgi:hypothetical protein
MALGMFPIITQVVAMEHVETTIRIRPCMIHVLFITKDFNLYTL